ncbi:hypothetical protein N9583_00580 [Burkholderiaceae bacterium]|jgi:hypothetical protein|nr:hypothetical protein [Burkholderiaceae bacterium]MDO7594563.1 hypothetical protein [Burkholderiaceae bacterium]|tara:strand:- start:359 stop:544 length:186 start_codon:yes stop_codon:yes gene_type:complete
MTGASFKKSEVRLSNKGLTSLFLRQSRILLLDSRRCGLSRIGMPAVDVVSIATDLDQMNRR